MISKSSSENVESSPKQVLSNGLTSISASNITSQNNNGLIRQKTNVRASSATAKYYDIASTILGGSHDVEELFLNSAKNGNCKKLEQLLQQSIEIGLNINCVDKRTGNTALIWASKRGHSKVIELLLRQGADATLCNYEAQTALETAFSSVRTIILDWVETQEELNERLLLQASWQGNFSIVKKILQNKSCINVNCQNAEGLTPLMLVCRDIQLFERLSSQLNRVYSPVQVAEELMKGKANIHVTDSDGRSCLHYTCQSHAVSAESLTIALVAGGLDIELRDKHLLTPLHLASQSGNTNNVVALADRGSNVNAKGFASLTPLHMTALKDHHLTALTLVRYGADVTITDDHGHTPFDVAKSRKMKNTLKEALIVAAKVSNLPVDAPPKNKTGVEVGKKSETVQKGSQDITSEDVVNNSSNISGHSRTAKSTQPKVLANIDKNKQVERKILQVVETFKAAHTVLQRETTRILGTPRTKILPKIGRSSSPDHSSKFSQANFDSSGRGSEGLQRSLEGTRNTLSSRGRSVLDIKLGMGRSNEKASTECVNQEIIEEGHSSRLRTSPVPKDLFIADKSSHHRSDSDPSAPSLRELAASFDSILPKTKGKMVIKSKPPDLNKDKTQKDSIHCDKASSHPEEDILRSMGSPSEIVRSRYILKDEFILEESRPKDISSGSDPASSISSCSQSSSSPRDLLFLQPSPSRSSRHDPSLSTLIEQQASTYFSTSDSFANTDGKPIIMKPHKKLRRKSDNSLSSSLESDMDDLRTDIKITRSNSLRNTDKTDQELISLSRPLPVFKCQSMDTISPRTATKVSVDFITSSSVSVKSSSEGNLDTPQKDSMQTVNMKPCQAVSDRKVAQSKVLQSAAKCIKPSKKSIVEPFIGKTKVLSNTKVDSLTCSSSDTSTETRCVANKSTASKATVSQKLQNSCNNVGQCRKTMNSCNSKSSSDILKDQRPERNIQQSQKICCAAEVRPVSVSTTVDTSEPQTSKSVSVSRQKLSASEKSKILVTFHQSDSKTQPSPVLKNINVYLSSTPLNIPSTKLPSSDTSIMSPASATSQSHLPDNCPETSNGNVISENSNNHRAVCNQRIEKAVILNQSKANEAYAVKADVKQPCKTTGDFKTKSDINAILLKAQKKLPLNICQEKIKYVANMPVQFSSDRTDIILVDGTKDVKDDSFTAKKQSEQNDANIVSTETLTKVVPCKEESNKIYSETSQIFKKTSTETVAKYGHKSNESNKLTLNVLTRFSTPKPNIQLKSMSVEPFNIARSQSATARPIFDAPTKQINISEIATPIIVNPFEEFVQAHISAIGTSTKDVLVSGKKSHPSKITNKCIKKTPITSRKKQNSSILRQPSAGRKQSAKVKDVKTEKESRIKSGRKSGKGQRSKKEKINETDLNEAMKPDTNIISGNQWHLSTSCAHKSNEGVFSDLHFDANDSDISLDIDTNKSPFQENHFCKAERLNNNTIQTSIDEVTDNSPIFLELRYHPNSLLNLKLPVAENDGFPPMNLDMAEDTHDDLEQRHRITKHKNMVEGELQFSKDMSSEKYPNNSGIQKEVPMDQFSPTSNVPFFSRNINAASACETSDKKPSFHHGSATLSPDNEDNMKQTSETFSSKSKSSQNLNSEHGESTRNEEAQDDIIVNYEYTPSGKTVRRTQSLKELQKRDKLKEFKFSEFQSQQKVAEKVDENEDVDNIIEEILSSTTSSLASTLKNVKNSTSSHISGVQTITESDRSLLLRMSSSKFNSPFHAKTSITNLGKTDAVPDVSEGNANTKTVSSRSKMSSLSGMEDVEKQSLTNQGLTPLATDTQNHSYAISPVSSKPPHPVRPSLNDEGSLKAVTLGRSSSSREFSRQRMNPMSGVIVTGDEAEHLAKILSSFKHMKLHANTNGTYGRNGSTKEFSRNKRSTLRCGKSSLSQPVSRGASFGSKGKFQEMKDKIVTRISTEFKDVPQIGLSVGKAELVNCGLTLEEETLLQNITSAYMSPVIPFEEGSHQFLNKHEDSITDSECTLDSIKYDSDDTIQWKKGNVLGRGAFGTVWCGLTNEGQLIAVKQIELTTMDKSKAQHEYEKVQEEVELLKTLEHVNIVSYLGTSLEDNIVSIFMQFIPGGSIASILARFGALEESVFRLYTKQILEGVKYLHSNDVIHRDIKGANVMLMPNGVIKLIDFGCAKRLCINLSISQTELLKSMNGTPFWMAPEVVNESGHGKKSDIWSIGCTVFEMATRKPPWADMNPMAAIFAIGSPTRPVPSLGNQFSQDARDFVSQCMTRDQNTRPGASELQEHPFIIRQTSKRPSRSGD